MQVTSHIFEAYLKCSTKCWLRSRGEKGTANIYAEWVQTQSETYREKGIEQLLNGCAKKDIASPQAGSQNAKTARWKFAPMFQAKKEQLESTIHLVERIPPEGRGRPAHFVPVRCIVRNKLTKDDKLLLAYDAHLLSAMLDRDIAYGKIIYGDNYTTHKVRTSQLVATVRKLTSKITTLLASDSPPDLILNKHCAECEYQSRCRQKAIEKDDLCLLAGMTEKERKKLNSKGIFTVTQLSYTFRPRRRPKRLRDKREKYHHSLKALAIREKKIHIVGCLEINIEGTPVYLDVEGLPDNEFYYLLGMRVRQGDSVVQHSFWADKPEDEERIWKQFIERLSMIEKPVLVHYGSYESDFLKRMCERYGNPPLTSIDVETIKKTINLLSVLYAQIYFPGFSNGLKDVASFLGYMWTDTDCSGILSIMWRHLWNDCNDISIKNKLIRYNSQDCEALELVTNVVLQVLDNNRTESNISDVVHADSEKFIKNSKWGVFSSPFSSLEYINSAAQWNYLRDRVYARLEISKPYAEKKLQKRKNLRPEITIRFKHNRTCPTCKRLYYRKGEDISRNLLDVLFGRRSMKLRLVQYVFKTYTCRKCGTTFGIPDMYCHGSRKYGWNLHSYIFYQVVELHIPQRTVFRSINRMFGIQLSRSSLHHFKSRMADYYSVTKQHILNRILNSDVIHIDETRANIKGVSAFVWILTSYNDVVYVLSESREGEIAHKLLVNFNGVLVSDFYTAYDSINCPQQKCLIHLMRDLNDEVLSFPFDEQLKQIIADFGELLRSIVETIDRRGLKKYFLKKHLSHVERFFLELESNNYSSESAVKCKERFERNRETLFTFLKYDGVPWNNNNAEHAVKAFARLRDIIEGSSTVKGTEEYLTLLSVCQTCKYRGLDFLDFMRSGEKDIDAFAASQRRRRVIGTRRLPTSPSPPPP